MLSDKWTEEYEKLEKICEQNSIEFHVHKDKFPVTFNIKPLLVDTAQMALSECERGVQNEIAMEFIFDEELSVKFIGDFTIDDETLNKIKNAAKKLHYIWLQIWFKGKDARWNKYRYPNCFRSPERAMSPDSNGYVMVYVPAKYRP